MMDNFKQLATGNEITRSLSKVAIALSVKIRL